MTPYTKKIVELHKIHKAIEEKDCCNGGGDKEITIDDVVKFIHDNISSDYREFPYTKYDDIPDIPNNIENGTPYVKCTLEELDELYDLPDILTSVIFSIGNYNIVLIHKQHPIG